MRLPKMTEWAHALLAKYIQKGNVVVDATAGNGYDTLFLAQRVGEGGKVYAFDIQAEALHNTRMRIENAGLKNVTFINDSHERMLKHIVEPVQAVIFNLGYLPGGDKKITTNASSSIVAIEQSLGLITSGGIVIVVVYPGHPEGKMESEAIEQWIRTLDERQFHVLKIQYVNRTISPPYVLAIHKNT